MSGAIDRLRTARDGRHALAHVWPADLRDALSALDAAEAECARLTTELDAARRAATFAEMERDTLRGLTDAMRADNVRLRAIVEGRTVPPTDAEIAAHERAGGRWRCALVHLRGGHDWMDDDDARAKVRLSAPGTWRWWPLDASGRPCPWPTPALGAAGEGR